MNSRALLDEFYNKKGFFNDYEMPEYTLPTNMDRAVGKMYFGKHALSQ